MDDAIRVEVGEGHSYVMAEINLSVVRGVVCRIAPGTGSNSHPLTPLGALAALTQDHGMCPSIGQCGGALYHSKDDTLAQTFA